MKPGKLAWVKGRKLPFHKVTIVEFGKGPSALVRFEDGREQEVRKEALQAKPPKEKGVGNPEAKS